MVNETSDYELANKIRKYVEKVESDNYKVKSKKWAKWAIEKADWIDPTILKKDFRLGKRKSWCSPNKKYPEKEFF